MEHPILGVMERQGRRWDWLAREIGYDPSHLSRAAKGKVRAPGRLRRLCAITLAMPESELFHPESSARAATQEASAVA